jgi:Tol biopolymer transport system component
MKRLNGLRMQLVLIGIMAVIVLGGGNAMADFTFGEPTELGPTVNGYDNDSGPDLSADDLSLFFSSKRNGNAEIWMTTRTTKDDPWGEPVNLGLVGSDPSISADGLSLFFRSKRSGGYGGADLWVTLRVSKDDPWGEPVNLGPVVNSSGWEQHPDISADGLTLYFGSNRDGGLGRQDVWVTTRPTTEDEWGEPVNLGSPINRPWHEGGQSLSSDGSALFFGKGSPRSIWMSRWNHDSLGWGTPVWVGFNYPSETSLGPQPSVSSDGSTLYFCAGAYGYVDLWQSTISPIVDFNGDGIVDASDMVIMVDHWGTDNSLCDIGPMPWGDGVVDVEDLIVFIKYWEQENMPEVPEEE